MQLKLKSVQQADKGWKIIDVVSEQDIVVNLDSRFTTKILIDLLCKYNIDPRRPDNKDTFTMLYDTARIASNTMSGIATAYEPKSLIERATELYSDAGYKDVKGAVHRFAARLRDGQ